MLLYVLPAVFLIICISMVFQGSNFKVVSAQSDVQIVSHRGFLDPLDKHYYVCGEVFNAGSQTLSFIEVSADFFDQSGSRIAGYSHRASLDNLSPSTNSPFKIEVTNTDQSARVSTYELTAVALRTTDAFPKELVILSAAGTQDDHYVNKYVEGVVKQNTNYRANSVRVIATFYDYYGEVVYTDFDTIDVLEPNVAKPYEIDFYASSMPSMQDWLNVTYCSVTAESMEYSSNLKSNILFQGLVPEMPPLFVPLILAALLVSTLFTKKWINMKKYKE
jgi:hypothetical protein